MFQVNSQSSYSSSGLNSEVTLLKEEVPLSLSRKRFNEAMRNVCQLPPFNNAVFCGSVTLPLEPHVTVKACTCASGFCPQHVCEPEKDVDVPPKPPSISRSSGTFIAKRPKSVTKLPSAHSTNPKRRSEDDQKISTVSISSKDSESNFQKWLAEKNQNKRLLEQQRANLEVAIMAERAKKREQERMNFLHWLEGKKAAEKSRPPSSQIKQGEIDKAEKEKKQLECDLKFQLWRKRKEEEYLESKLKEQVEKLQAAEDRKKRIEMNAAAYEEWLKNSKNKQKPLPMNRGLDSLRASVSVSYVNPTPWEPNIVKPATQ